MLQARGGSQSGKGAVLVEAIEILKQNLAIEPDLQSFIDFVLRSVKQLGGNEFAASIALLGLLGRLRQDGAALGRPMTVRLLLRGRYLFAEWGKSEQLKLVSLNELPAPQSVMELRTILENSVALVDPERTPARVCARTVAARDEGVDVGLTATQAQARCGAVQIRPRSTEREAIAAEAVAQAAFAFSPSVEATAPGLWTLDLRALAALKDADAAALGRWGECLRRAVAGLDLKPRIGVGATPNLARHAALWGAGQEAPVHVVTDSGTWVASLPVTVLDPSDAVAGILEAWGVRTVGALTKLGLAAVADRLGLEALSLFAAAEVKSVRPLRLMKPVERFVETYEFEEPVTTLEPVLFLVRRLVDQLSRRLEPPGLVASGMILKLRLESGDILVPSLTVPDPTRDADVLFRMWHTHLESVRTDSPVTAMTLTVQPGRVVARQFQLFQAVLRDPGQLQETLGRLEALLGPGRVGTPVRVPGHQRDAFRLALPDFENAPVDTARRSPLLQPVPWRRLRPAPPAQVDAAGPAQPEAGCQPAAVRCAVVSGRLKITLGPWRASGQWWDAHAWSREEWEVETTRGITARLSHSADGWRITDILD